MTTAADLRELAHEAFRKSELAACLPDVQWFLKVRRVLWAAADELDRCHGLAADLEGAPGADNVVRIEGAKPRGVYPMVSAEQYEKDRRR